MKAGILSGRLVSLLQKSTRKKTKLETAVTQKLIDSGMHGFGLEPRRVHQDRIGSGLERRHCPVAIAVVAGANFFAKTRKFSSDARLAQLRGTPARPFLRGRVHENLQRSVREHDPHVPSVALKRDHPNYAPPTSEDVEQFYEHLERVLLKTGFLDPKNPGLLMRRLRVLFNRTQPDSNELAILRGILKTVEKPKRRSSRTGNGG